MSTLMVLASFATMSELPVSESNHCEDSECLRNRKLHGIKRQRTSSESSLKSISITSQNRLISDSISQSFAISPKLKDYFRNHFEQSVKHAVDGVLNRVLAYSQTVNDLRAETEKLRARLEKMEVSTEKISTLIAKNRITEMNIILPPADPLPIETAMHPHLPVPVENPTITANLTPSSSAVDKTLDNVPLKATPSAASISTLLSISQDSLSRNATFADVIDLTAEITPNTVDSLVTSTLSNPCDVFASTSNRANDSTPLVESKLSSVVSTSSSRTTTTFTPPDRDVVCLDKQVTVPTNCMNMFPSLSHSQLVAPLPIWYPPLITRDKAGHLTTPRVQPPLFLVISPAEEGVSLRWELSVHNYPFEPAVFYELFSYASSDVDPFSPLTSDVWQKVGDVEALPLPMICTLTSVISKNIYYFIVRSKDRLNRRSDWSNVVNAHVS